MQSPIIAEILRSASIGHNSVLVNNIFCFEKDGIRFLTKTVQRIHICWVRRFLTMAEECRYYWQLGIVFRLVIYGTEAFGSWIRFHPQMKWWQIIFVRSEVFRGGDYEECSLLGYKNPVRTSQETYYVTTAESSQLMLCKIWGVHDSDYEECRLLGYKNRVRTCQETYYVTTTESSLLMLCKIWGFQGGDCEECRLLECYQVCLF
jgi:hypothetical protein